MDNQFSYPSRETSGVLPLGQDQTLKCPIALINLMINRCIGAVIAGMWKPLTFIKQAIELDALVLSATMY